MGKYLSGYSYGDGPRSVRSIYERERTGGDAACVGDYFFEIWQGNTLLRIEKVRASSRRHADGLVERMGSYRAFKGFTAS